MLAKLCCSNRCNVDSWACSKYQDIDCGFDVSNDHNEPPASFNSYHIQHYLLRILHQRFEPRQKCPCHSTIYQAMVKRESQRHHRSRYDLALMHDRLLLQPTDREDGYFGMIDDRGATPTAKAAHVVERKSAATEFPWEQCAFAGTFKESLKFTGDRQQVEAISITQHRHEQPFWCSGCQADMVRAFVDDLAPLLV